MIEAATYSILTTGTATPALVADRVWPQSLRQDPTLPAITFLVVASPKEYTHDGPSGLANPRVQVNCWAATYDGAVGLANAVKADLANLSFPMVLDGTRVDTIFVDGERDDYDPDRRLQRRILDLRYWNSE